MSDYTTPDATAIYSNLEIKDAISKGHIVCEPFIEKHLNGSSLDITLGEYYYRTGQSKSGFIYNPFDKSDVESYFGELQKATPHGKWCAENRHKLLKNIPEEHPIIVLGPGERILGHTQEFVGIKPPGTTSIQARSTWGRNGIAVCFDAGWGDPGYINRWTLEIYNLNMSHSVALPVGERLAQIIFMHTGEVEGDYTDLSGNYQTLKNIDELINSWSPEQILPKAYKDYER